jgi:uncharacterized protein with GYD domain
MGGEMKQFYMVMSEFDFVGICEAPDGAVMALTSCSSRPVEAAGTTSTYSIRRTSRAGWYVHGDGLPVQD